MSRTFLKNFMYHGGHMWINLDWQSLQIFVLQSVFLKTCDMLFPLYHIRRTYYCHFTRCLASSPSGSRPDSGQPQYMVGGMQKRKIPQTRQTRTAYDRLASLRHPCSSGTSEPAVGDVGLANLIRPRLSLRAMWHKPSYLQYWLTKQFCPTRLALQLQ